jgi:hypothetical protein
MGISLSIYNLIKRRSMEELIGKLPFILSAVMALLAGILGLANNKSLDFIYGSMVISILSFGAIGVIIRSFILSIIKEKEDLQKEKENEEPPEKSETKGNVIDLKVDDSNSPDINDIYGDGFTPLEVSKVIQTSMKKDEK